MSGLEVSKYQNTNLIRKAVPKPVVLADSELKEFVQSDWFNPAISSGQYQDSVAYEVFGVLLLRKPIYGLRLGEEKSTDKYSFL